MKNKNTIFILFAIILSIGIINFSTINADIIEEPVQTILSKDSIYSLIQDRFDSIKPIFERSCFDCHSTKTNYPWYHSIPVIKGFLDGHIKEAREHLDFSSSFPFLGQMSAKQQLGEILSEISDGDMPLLSYRLLHWNAKLSDEEIDTVGMWINYSLQLISSKRLPTVETIEDSDID